MKDRKTITLQREALLERASMQEESRTVAISLSSEAPVRTMFGDEVLEHSERAVDMSRDQGNGFPLLWSHDPGTPIGRVRGIRIEDGRLRGNAEFSDNSERAQQVWADVRDGFLDSVSIGYRIDDYEAGDGDAYTVTRWTPLEASIVSVPADAQVGVGRNLQEIESMTDEVKAGTAKAPDNVEAITAAHERAKAAGRVEGQQIELERQSQVRELFVAFKGEQYDELRDACVNTPTTVDDARKRLLDLVGSQNGKVVGSDYRQPEGGGFHDAQTYADVTGGETDMEKWRRGATEAIELRGDMYEGDAAARSKLLAENPFVAMTLAELARDYLQRCGVSMRGLTREGIAGEAFVRAGVGSHGTSDFSAALADVANKAMLMGWTQSQETWSLITRQQSLPDFKPASLVALSLFPDLDPVLEGGEFKHKTIEDIAEKITLLTYGNLFSISRQAITNDDIPAFTSIPSNMGGAANRRIGDLVYNILINNPVMTQDGVALFDATHNNIGTGGPPTMAAVDEARVGMGLQKDPAGVTVGLRPTLMIVPLELEGTAIQLTQAEYDPASTAGTLAPNTVRETYIPVADHRLSADSALKWYMSSNPSISDALIVGFLNGQSAPFLDSMNGWSIDGIEYKVRIDAAAIPGDYRGLWQNLGV